MSLYNKTILYFTKYVIPNTHYLIQQLFNEDLYTTHITYYNSAFTSVIECIVVLIISLENIDTFAM